jgi:dTDP-4-dehydrorhamnose 3,5-epimerase
MIEGVKIKQLKVHQDIPDADQPDVRPGFLMEVLRNDEGMLPKFGQTTYTVAYQGTIKAFHWHELQDDFWFVATGKAVIVMHDMRESSPTKGQTDTVTAGVDDYKLVLIPRGVAHGYKVISQDPVLLFYHTTQPYNSKAPDEKRIPYNDPSIGFDWNKF